MAVAKRLKKAATELNISLETAVEFLEDKGFEVNSNPNHKLAPEEFESLLQEFSDDMRIKEKSAQIQIGGIRKETIDIAQVEAEPRQKGDLFDQEVLIKGITTSKEEAPKVEEKVKEPVLGKLEKAKNPVAEVVEEVKEPVAETVEEQKEPVAGTKEPVETPEPVVEKEKALDEVKKEDSKGGFKVLGKIDLDKVPKTKKKKKKAEIGKETLKKEPETVKKDVVETPTDDPAETIIEGDEQTVEEVENPKSTEQIAVTDSTEAEEESAEIIRAKAGKLAGTKVLGKIDITKFAEKKKKPVASSEGGTTGAKRKRKRREKAVKVDSIAEGKRFRGKRKTQDTEISEKEIQEKVKATLSRLTSGSKFGSRAKIRKQKRDDAAEEKRQKEIAVQEQEQSQIKVTEFCTTSELAQLLSVSVSDIISTCFTMGLVVSINQRLDAETITFISDEFNYTVEFVGAEEDEPNLSEEDTPENVTNRSPIVTIMGHVDHGKTSLLDYIRDTNVIAGEAGGITQHIGAYEVIVKGGKKITFLDTPGHEAFTAMRARGAKVTDIVVIVVAADDRVMPQTKEAISHAQAAGVPIIFALNKIDKEGADPEKVKGQLAEMNLLVEDWGGKYQSQDISAKTGLNVDELMEKILLEAEVLELKADPVKRGIGTVIEAKLDKGKGVVTTILIQEGQMLMGDSILAGAHAGRVKALLNERNQRVERIGPSQPVQLLGFNGSPQAGDKLYVTKTEQQAKDIATKRQQLIREQGIRTKKHITLDEIGRRLAIGDFQELNLIVKGDVDGSVEALSDSLQKLSTENIQVNIIHKGVGQISESDVNLALASDAIIIGFQVRAYPQARKVAEKEEIDIRYYSIIYDAIEEIKSAMEGMLAPSFEEKITCNIEVRDVFKITKVGTIAGCYVLDGKMNRNTKIRLVRDGIVIYTGELASLKRFKDDVKEVSAGYECGLGIANYNDLKTGDIIEGFERVEVKAKL